MVKTQKQKQKINWWTPDFEIYPDIHNPESQKFVDELLSLIHISKNKGKIGVKNEKK